MRTLSFAIVAAGALAGCAHDIGGPGVSTYFECERGTRLKVDYLSNGAFVGIDGRKAIPLKQVPAVSGTAYESRQYQLQVQGGGARWIDSRLPAQSCSQVRVPR